MKALFVAYQDAASRTWAPVGRLTREDGRYHFAYTRGAKDLPSFVPFCRMTDLNAEYVSDKLFPLFANRVLPKSRPEYSDYLQWLGLSGASHDALEELARTGGLRATDTLELIPCPAPTEGNRYEVFFFCRGLRHLSEENQTRALQLQPGRAPVSGARSAKQRRQHGTVIAYRRTSDAGWLRSTLLLRRLHPIDQACERARGGGYGGTRQSARTSPVSAAVQVVRTMAKRFCTLPGWRVRTHR